ncbi:alpha-ketoglutarate-dependent dioxygenase AlkB [Dactylosporangium sp. NBC_01737]|uniref:alpha-ketoglutarate-dependent dioxygenase AlkB n=1 Tax=Dactylosporangium sp. NBC_01737 TaxID=2975959 RepID=UPI002E11E0FB|nr:alpha-ketoglutarate-dependent dioxygenase AlkB [Dactylosporangium sp. NBC_01737]
MDIDGLTNLPGYLDADGQRDLLATIDALPWRDDLRRRVQHYGYRYDYNRKRVDAGAFLGPLPAWAGALAGRLHRDGHAPAPPDQVIVNEYQPGQGIAPHVDCVPCFAGTVLSVSLGSACVMTYTLPKSAQRLDVLMEPGSLLVMRGPARYDWRHGIAARKTDRWQDAVITRGRRVSLTFRTVLPS